MTSLRPTTVHPPTDDPEPPLWEQWQARDLPEGVRLQKVLAAAGWGSRRSCEVLITDGRVQVNGDVAVLGRRVDPEQDTIEVDGVRIAGLPGQVYYLLNKPVGVVTTVSDPQGRPSVVEYVPDEVRVFPVGRLDLDSEGLLILTNDGDFAHRLMHPSHGVDKEYLVEVDRGPVSAAALRQLRTGVMLDDGPSAPAQVSQPEAGILRITIHEGRNRQVRRMCEAVGHRVKRLVRIRIGPVADRRLPPGHWRELTAAEVVKLSRATSDRPPGSFTRSQGYDPAT